MRLPDDEELSNCRPVPPDDNRMDWHQARPNAPAAWHLLEHLEGGLHVRPDAKTAIGCTADQGIVETAGPSRGFSASRASVPC